MKCILIFQFIKTIFYFYGFEKQQIYRNYDL